MKIKIDSTKFQPYKIASLQSLEKSTLENFLKGLFSIDSTETTKSTNDMVNPYLLTCIAYGLPVLIMKGYENVSSVTEIIRTLRLHYLEIHNYNLVYACNFFLDQFLQATHKDFNSLSASKIKIKKTPLLCIETLFNQLDQLTSKERDKLIAVISHDLRLLNFYAFLNLETPISEHSLLVIIYNKLKTFIKQDLNSTKSNAELTSNKVHVYLKIATKLLDKNPIPDFHGAGIIVMALTEDILHSSIILDKEKMDLWNKMSVLYSPLSNFKNLRVQMKKMAIPALWVTIKDLSLILENSILIYRLELTGKIYFDLAEKKRNITKEIKFPTENFKTNLVPLLGLSQLFFSKQSPSLNGFFQSRKILMPDETEQICLSSSNGLVH